MATTHASHFTWEIPRTEEPGGVQSMGSQKSWTQLSNSATMIVLRGNHHHFTDVSWLKLLKTTQRAIRGGGKAAGLQTHSTMWPFPCTVLWEYVSLSK